MATETVGQIAARIAESDARAVYNQTFVMFADGMPDRAAAIRLARMDGDDDPDAPAVSVEVSGAAIEALKHTDPRNAVRSSGDGDPAPKMRQANLYSRIHEQPKDKPFFSPDEATLRALASAMRNDTSAQALSDIPAAYTYLGQFVAHDMTWMKPSADPERPINLRTHALDLDSVFGPVEEALDGDYRIVDGIPIGSTSAGRFEDLPRTRTGVPCIADKRNDNNLVLSQLTAAIMRFHHLLCRLTPAQSSADQRQITRRHIQSVVLHDYLGRIIHPDVHDDIMNEGRKVIYPGGVPPLFQVPIEFAAACFRFGHSMVRDTYAWTRNPGDWLGETIRRQSHLLSINANRPRLDDLWTITWTDFLGFPNSQPLMTAAAVGGRISADLRSLDRQWVEFDPGIPIADTATPNLAELTLARGRHLGLPSGQMLQQFLSKTIGTGAAGAPAIAISLASLARGPGQRVGLDGKQISEIEENTPLWFYVLREAEAYRASHGTLGPMASRIVMETIHAAIEADGDGILRGGAFASLPALGAQNAAEFHLGDLITAIAAA